jgi:hypothetical protein
MASKMIERRSKTPPAGAKGKHAPAPQHGQGPSTVPLRDVGRLLDAARYAGYFITGLILLPGISILGRWLWAGHLSSRLAASVALTVAGALLVRAAWDESSPRANRYDRLRAAVSVAWLFVAVLGTSWAGGPGPWAVRRPWADVLWLVGFLLSLWWTVGALPAVAGRGHDAHGQGRDTLAERLGLGDSFVTDAEHDDKGIRSVYRFKLRGITIAQLRAALPLLAVSMGIPGIGLRAIEGTNADDATLVVVRQDVLGHMPPWPGPSRPGGSITEPVRSGLYEDGSEIEAVRYNRHKLTGGTSGAGKTEHEVTEFADIMTRCDVVMMWTDAVKPGQTLPDFAPAVTRVADTKARAKKMVVGLIAAVEYRAKVVGGRMWKPTPELPAIGAHFEEGAVLVEVLGSDLLAFVATARSVGIFITWSMQRPSGQALDTDVRAQFNDRACFGVNRSEDTDMILSERTIENGARPEDWKDEHPGKHYREAGNDPRKHSMPARGWLIPPSVLRAHVAEWAPRMAQLDAGTARAMGAAWTELQSGADYAIAHGWHRDGPVGPDGLAGWTPPRGDDDEDGGEPGSPVPAPRGPEPDDPTAGGTVPPGEPSNGDEMAGQDETTGPADGPDYGSPEPGRRAEPDTSRADERPDDDEDEDGMTADERAELTTDIETLRETIAAELGDIDPDIADALRNGEAGVYPGGKVAELELWTGDGEPLDYAGRICAVADALDKRMPAEGDGVAVSVADLADELTELPGWYTVAKPALYRVLEKAIAAGQALDREHGSYWIERTCPGWLRRELAHAPDTDREGEGDDAE